MSWIKDIIVRFKGDAGNLQSETRKAEQSVSGFGKTVSKIGPMAVAAFAAAGAAIVAFGTKMYRLYAEAERSEAKVAQAVRQTGYAAGFSSSQLNKMAKDLQKLTALDNDKILNDVTAQLLTFTNISGDIFKKAQLAALDLSATLDGNLQAAAIQLGKALNEPTQSLSALTRVGVQFSQAQKDQIKDFAETNRLAQAQAIILAEINRQYGGQARAMAQTSAGRIEAARLAWEDIGVSLGEITAPAVIKTANALEKLAENVQKPYSDRNWFGRFLADLDGFWHIKNLFGNFPDEVKKAEEAVNTQWRDTRQWKFQGFEEGQVERMWEEEYERLERIKRQAEETARAYTELSFARLQAAQEAGFSLLSQAERQQFSAPLGAVGLSLADVGGAQKPTGQIPMSQDKQLAGSIITPEYLSNLEKSASLWAKNYDEMMRTEDISWRLADALVDLGNDLAQGAETWEDFGRSALDALKQVVAGLIAKGIASQIEKAMSTLPVGIGVGVGALVGGLAAGVFSTALNQIPSFAEGGYVDRPTLARIGDAKDGRGEWVLNSGQMRALMSGGGGQLTTTISGRDLKIILDRENAFLNRT